ncbi:hypothetical protein [Proteiniphilum acetatigenes]|uniref:hypothetical protein n=1 Tax=Proteiniphilum acetatigenes TaxID=294710 RepID=UPI00036528C6|nr:hypothetical protein [Proteiniphilum acetatigenes]
MSPENTQSIILKYGFKDIYNGLIFERDTFTLRISDGEFEIYCDPEYDLRYYHGKIDQLEDVLNDL